MHAQAIIGLVSISDRASQGVYEDKGLPVLKAWLEAALLNPLTFVERLIPDEQAVIEATLKDLADRQACCLVLTTGGTGPAPRDRTPEGVAAVADFDLPGFGEAMRAANLKVVPTAILSRQGAAVRGQTLILTLPGSPNAIGTSLEAVFAAVPYCLELIGAGRIDTDPAVIRAHRPKA